MCLSDAEMSLDMSDLQPYKCRERKIINNTITDNVNNNHGIAFNFDMGNIKL